MYIFHIQFKYESGIHVSLSPLRLCSTEQDRFRRGMVRVVVMGVSGCGKSTVGAALATALGLQFYDGDDWHSAANKEKMAAGRPLTDQDRGGWLAALSRLLADTHCVLACSALKLAYRSVCINYQVFLFTIFVGRRQELASQVRGGGRLVFLHLVGKREELERRLLLRTQHYFPAGMLDSQLDCLEPPLEREGGHQYSIVTMDCSQSVQDIIHFVSFLIKQLEY